MKKYQIIYADPPWSYKVWSAKGGHKSASVHYATMELKDICKLPVGGIADENCILFLWAISPNLLEAFEVIQSWGFKYKTVGFVWEKVYNNGLPVCGLGYYTRSNAEYCLIATKGKPKRVNKGVYQIIRHKLGRHSQKPAEVRDRIIQLMGELPRIELFAREKTPGWDVWGNEVKSDIILSTPGQEPVN